MYMYMYMYMYMWPLQRYIIHVRVHVHVCGPVVLLQNAEERERVGVTDCCCRCLAGMRPGRLSAPSSNTLRACTQHTDTRTCIICYAQSTDSDHLWIYIVHEVVQTKDSPCSAQLSKGRVQMKKGL